jgi:hypothetical protein
LRWGGIKLSGNVQRNEGMGWVFNFFPSLKGLLRVGGWGFLFPFFEGVVSRVDKDFFFTFQRGYHGGRGVGPRPSKVPYSKSSIKRT